MATILEYFRYYIIGILLIFNRINLTEGQFSGWDEYISSWQEDERSSKMFPYGEEYYDWLLVSPNLGTDMGMNYKLPFYGREYSSAYLNVNGHIEFSNTKPATSTPKDPMTKWPNENYPTTGDPPFIAPYIASHSYTGLPDDPGEVFWRPLDPSSEEDDAKREIAEGMLDHLSSEVHANAPRAMDFMADYGFVVTWSQMKPAGCSGGECPINTMQIAVVTDGVRTYTLMNYYELNWLGGFTQGYNPQDGVVCLGTECTPAQAGFSAGDAQAFYSLPHSNTNNAMTLASIGRFTYEIHSVSITQGGCTNQTDVDPMYWPLVLVPDHGSMLGGEMIYVSGPCFHPSLTPTVHCKFGDVVVEGALIDGDYNRATCVSPTVSHIGHTEVRLSIDGQNSWPYTGTFFYNVPDPETPSVHLDNPSQWHARSVDTLAFSWDPLDLEDWIPGNSTDPPDPADHNIDLRLYAYFETEAMNGTSSELRELRIFEENIENVGHHEFDSLDYECDTATNCDWTIPLPVGLIEVRRADSGSTPRRIWSQPFPLGWFSNNALEQSRGATWADDLCTDWLEHELLDMAWMDDLAPCPISLSHAETDKGSFRSSWNCNVSMPIWPLCPRFPMPMTMAHHIVICYDQITPQTRKWAPTSHCCYNEEGNLLYAGDTDRPETSSPAAKAGPMGDPNASHGKVPMLSHFSWDLGLQVLCCNWTDMPSICQEGYMTARPTPDMAGYGPPQITSTYGDPHFLTYDGVEYTFNGRGEYWLLRVLDMEMDLDNINIQARLEMPKNETWGEIHATVMTAVAMREGYSTDPMTLPTIEVAIATPPSLTDLLVMVNGKAMDMTPEYSRRMEIPYSVDQVNVRKIYITNNEWNPHPTNRQSNISVIFPSGIMAQMSYQYGALHMITGLPDRYKGMTGGLFGLWNDVMSDDLSTPSGSIIDYTKGNEFIHYQFGDTWTISQESSCFTYRGSLGFASYYDPDFVPHFEEPELPENSPISEDDVDAACGSNFVCRFDYKTTYSRDLAVSSVEKQMWSHEIVNMSAEVPVCPYVDIPYAIRETTHYMAGGQITLNGCMGDYQLQGPNQYTCVDQGDGTAAWQPEPSSYCKPLSEIEEENKKLIIAIVVPICVVLLAIGIGVGAYFIHKNRKKKAAKKQPLPQSGSYPASSIQVTTTPNFNPAVVMRPPHEPELMTQGKQQRNTLTGSGDMGSLQSFSSSQHIDTRMRVASSDSSVDSSFEQDFTQTSAPAGYSSQPQPGYDRPRSTSEVPVQLQNNYNRGLSVPDQNLSPRSLGFVPTMQGSQTSIPEQFRDIPGPSNAPPYNNISAHSMGHSRQNLNQSSQSLINSRHDLSQLSYNIVEVHPQGYTNLGHAQSSHSVNQGQPPQYTSLQSLNRSHASQQGVPAQMSVYPQGTEAHHTDV